MLNIWPISFPTPVQEGFAATASSITRSADAQLNPWTIITSPFFNSGSFDTTSGNYTVPATGRYGLKATINYNLGAVIQVTLGSGIMPYFSVRRSAPAATDLITGYLPVLDVNISLVNIRAILQASTVTLSGEVELNAGDVVGLYYFADTFNLSLTFGPVYWSINRIT